MDDGEITVIEQAILQAHHEVMGVSADHCIKLSEKLRDTSDDPPYLAC